ncbi:MAG TPA: sigma factor-like helix-turn-helix DNA-binding protein, partial [Puia sp.]|nr:sigma factor-like helix-turn-helix DNA-binding protein [Puia sp.]
FLALGKQDLENEQNYLIKSVINRSITIKNRKKKMQPAAWLPEPVATERADADIRNREVLSYSMMVLLEQLNARERAVFILKEAFDYSHDEIAEILGMTIGNSRKLLSRAKSKLGSPGEKGGGSMMGGGEAAAYLERYVTVIRNGDTGTLEKMLSEEVAYAADGGGRIKVVSEFNAGIGEVAKQLSYVFKTFQQKLMIRTAMVNHQPALLFFKDGALVACQVFELDADGKWLKTAGDQEEADRRRPAMIRRIYNVVDPDKLRNFNEL